MLDVHAAQARRIDPVAERLRPGVAGEVRGGVGMTIGVAVEAGDPAARADGAAVFRGIELLLRKGREQEPQALELLGIKDAVEQGEVIVERDHVALRHVAEVRAGGEKNRRGEFRQKVIGQVEIEVEPSQIALLLPLEFVDDKPGKQHAALGMIRVWQRHETRGEKILRPDLLGRQRRQPIPREAGLEPGAGALLHGLPPRHGDAVGRPVGQVVAFRQKILVRLHDPGFRLLHALPGHIKRFLEFDRQVARSRRGRGGCRLSVGAGAHAEQQGEERGRDSRPRRMPDVA